MHTFTTLPRMTYNKFGVPQTVLSSSIAPLSDHMLTLVYDHMHAQMMISLLSLSLTLLKTHFNIMALN